MNPFALRSRTLACFGQVLLAAAAFAIRVPAADPPPTIPASESKPATALILVEHFESAVKSTNAQGIEWILPLVDPGIPWSELVVSWNTEPATRLEISARSVSETHTSEWFILGRWSADPSRGPRTSVNGQDTPDARVATDTLILRRRSPRAQVRLVFPTGGDAAGLRLVVYSFSDPTRNPPPNPPDRRAWGRELAVPIRSQADYPEGVQNWCSPTSLSMVLAHWAKRLARPELDVNVPTTAAAVLDPGWPGTGNWPFNTAFAGSLPGLRACVARLDDLREVEGWIAAGSPVVASVSGSLLRGLGEIRAGEGHLVVIRGFSADSDVMINDPGVAPARGQRTIPRALFLRAWAASHRTVYFVWPATGAGARPAELNLSRSF
jgi:hypothetical protein